MKSLVKKSIYLLVFAFVSASAAVSQYTLPISEVMLPLHETLEISLEALQPSLEGESAMYGIICNLNSDTNNKHIVVGKSSIGVGKNVGYNSEDFQIYTLGRGDGDITIYHNFYFDQKNSKLTISNFENEGNLQVKRCVAYFMP